MCLYICIKLMDVEGSGVLCCFFKEGMGYSPRSGAREGEVEIGVEKIGREDSFSK